MLADKRALDGGVTKRSYVASGQDTNQSSCFHRANIMASKLVLVALLGAVCCVYACPDKPTVLTRSLVTRDNSAERASGVCATSGEVICSSDCKRVVLCTRDENTWNQIVVQNCTSGRYCDAKEKTCHSGLSTCSPTDPPVYRLHCTSTGSYPDPYDCTVYHTCPVAGAPSLVHSCNAGYAYDALTTRCDLTYDHRVCAERPVPECVEAAASGPVPENPNIYWVCLRTITGLLPELYRCLNNGQYDGVQCVE